MNPAEATLSEACLRAADARRGVPPDAAASAGALVLAVDDEANVLAALRRALRARGFRVVTAEGGEAALALLAREPVDAIVSDMRMPGMNGAAFLRAARTACPQAVRLLLTGQADAASALQAVNEGEVFRYLTKPWDDAELAALIDEGVARERLRAERDRLLALTERQNAELATLNTDLEARVAARTAELEQALAHQDAAQQQLRQGLTATLQMLAVLTEARAGLTRGNARRVAEHVQRIGPMLGLAGAALQDAVFAAMLVDLGKTLLPERLTLQPWAEVQGADRQSWLAHPSQAAAMLIGNPALQGAAELLRALHERHDGSGVPDRLAGEAIPLGARLLAVANDYEAMCSGAVVRARLEPGEALQMLRQTAGQRHDPVVVEHLARTLGGARAAQRACLRLPSSDLRPGMQLCEDLRMSESLLLLPAGRVLDPMLIRQLVQFEARAGQRLTVAVHPPEEA